MFYVNEVSENGFVQHGPYPSDADSARAAWTLARDYAAAHKVPVPASSSGAMIPLGMVASFAYGVTVPRAAPVPFRTLAQIETEILLAEAA